VMITVDQLRPDYLDRYRSQFTGGFARLLKGGAVFTDAYQDHATTETAPGHASILSGRFPRNTGIVLNSIGVGDSTAPLIHAKGEGASPFRFQGTTLVDWLVAQDSHTRVLSISRKDRAAILPIGRGRYGVYWYAADGHFTTSRYYADTLPTWLATFNAHNLAQRYAMQSWTPLLPDSAYAELDSVPVEGGGTDFVFPHTAPADSGKALAALSGSPWMDQLTLDAAMAGIDALHLGAGPETDLVSISLSTTDAIGHRFGPDSKEIHDQVIRLDRFLGVFLDSLYRVRDASRTLIALTADHGVTPFPELTVVREHHVAQRVDLSILARQYRDALIQRGVARDAFQLEESILLVDRPALAAAHVDADSVVAAFAAQARQNPGIARVHTRETLAHADTVHDAIARRWVHALPPAMPVALVMTLTPGSVWGGGLSAHHGSPYDIDAHVPLIFYGPACPQGQSGAMVRTVDIAPTFATVLGVTSSEPLDGHALSACHAVRTAP
jgi:predicted AlkP superfamily pyrophosphatase or phosphodiesterase